ncbi:DUF84 family protein [Oceanobacillus jeddahense]|uniref:inosine/xanthosine triphosphatase n=1 Tax=Oceanobacillus jeddahense TaxID=1462527 RepID=A0ABY5JNF1_9BACI|nr:DUF84 family protein [Oceanobacillus jeddahense]UUI01835.1 DUF84 family protein [Oceanobacillus jeddahense]
MQKTVIIGSKNPTKVQAVRNIFQTSEVNSLDVPSNVSIQPFSDEETRMGAVNRAKACAASSSGAIGIGLEGGVMYVDETLFLCNWGALATGDGKLYTASGARIAIPKEIEEELKITGELSTVMDAYTKKENVRSHEGAIGIFTNNCITREDMFTHVVQLLKGQYEFANFNHK